MSTIATRRRLRSLSLLCTAGLLGGCPAPDAPGTGAPADNGAPVDAPIGGRARISAAEGGRIVIPGGLELRVPAGALDADTDIAVQLASQSELAAAGDDLIAAVALEPDGLTFSEPATLFVPLPEPWPEGDAPLAMEFKGIDPANAYQTGELVELSADRRTAIFRVSHFSGRACARQCHAGVREFLIDQFRARDCGVNEWPPRVRGKYGITLDESCQSISPGEIHAIVDTFFEDYGGWNAGEPIPAGNLAELEAFAEEGRNIVFFYSKDAFGPRGGTYEFYPGLAHSAVVERRNGQWMLRNSFVPSRGFPLELLNGEALVWWPLADVNTFRDLVQGVAIEMSACGAPGCLGSDDPFDTSKPYDVLEKRTVVPWNACRVFVERPDNVPCNRLAGCWRFAPEELDGGTFLLRFTDDGQIDSLWIAGPGDPAQPDAPQVFGEFVRFARPNAGSIGQRLTGLDAGVFPIEDQSQFTASWSFGFRGFKDGRLSSESEFFFALNSAHLSRNRPEEYFDAEYVQDITITSYDEDGEATVNEDRFSGRVRAYRIKCPTVEDGTALTQEDVVAEFGEDEDFDFSLCGVGAAGAMPLMFAGLCLGKWRRSARRAARRAAT